MEEVRQSDGITSIVALAEARLVEANATDFRVWLGWHSRSMRTNERRTSRAKGAWNRIELREAQFAQALLGSSNQ